MIGRSSDVIGWLRWASSWARTWPAGVVIAASVAAVSVAAVVAVTWLSPGGTDRDAQAQVRAAALAEDFDTDLVATLAALPDDVTVHVVARDADGQRIDGLAGDLPDGDGFTSAELTVAIAGERRCVAVEVTVAAEWLLDGDRQHVDVGGPETVAGRYCL